MPDNKVLFNPQRDPQPGGPQPGSPVAPEERKPRVMFRPQTRQEDVAFTQSLSTALALDSPVAAVARRIELAGMPMDPSFLLTKDVQDELTADVPEALQVDLLDVLTEATSRKHADVLKEQYVRELQREKVLQDAGMGGLATRLLANVIDPANLALAWGTGGVGVLTKSTALQGALRVGTWTAAESAAMEALVVSGSHTRGVDDIALSALAGFALGSGVGALLGRSTPDVNKGVDAAVSRQVDSIKAEALEAADLDSAGAARVRGYTDPLMEPDVAKQFDISGDTSVPKAAFGNIRYDAVGRLGIDEDPWIRDLGRGLAEEGVGVEGHGAVRFGASEYAAVVHRRLMSDFRRTSEPEYGNWLRENNLGWGSRFSLDKRDSFFSEVGEAVISGDSPSKAVTKAADSTRRAFHRYLNELKTQKVAGFEDIPFNPNYMPRIGNHSNIREIVTRYGGNELERLVSVGLRASAGDMDADTVKRIAKGYVTKFRRMAQGMDIGLSHGIKLDDVDFLKSMLRETDLDEDAIDSVVNGVRRSQEKQSKTSRAKRRLDIDLNASIKTRNKLTGKEDVLKLSSMFEMNAEKLLFQYSRSMSGWAGLAKQVGIKSPGDVAKIINNVRARGERFGKSIEAVDANAKRVEFLIKGITGVPLETDPASVFATTARVARDFNFLRVGGAFGMAQLAEIGNALGAVGFRNLMAHVPELRKMLKRGANGKLESELASDIEDMLAPGVDRLLNQASTRWEEHGFGVSSKGIGKVVDNAVQVAKRATADIGGLNGMTIIFQRMAASGIAQKLAGFAHGANLTKAQRGRLRGMGITDAMWERIADQLRKHGTTKKSFVPGNRKLTGINPSKWDDDVMDDFTMALHREARRVVQENDIGSSTPWLHTTTGKLMTQFRTFSMTAWTKQTLHNVHHHDRQAFSMAMASMFMASLSYIAQQSVNVADKDRREERLQPAEIAKAAFQRSAVASIVPMMVDTAATTVFRADPLFAYGRSSGLATGFIQGISTVDAYDKLARAAGLPAVAARPDMELTKRDYRSLTALLPVLGGVIGVRRGLDALADGLPD